MPWSPAPTRSSGSVVRPGLRVEGLVHAGRDVGALLVDHVDDAAGLRVKAVLGAVVADAADHVARDGLDVEVGLGAHLAGHHDGARGDEGLARAADVVHVGGGAGRGDVALGLELGLLGEERVQDGVGDLVADLVRVALRHALGGEIRRPVLLRPIQVSLLKLWIARCQLRDKRRDEYTATEESTIEHSRWKSLMIPPHFTP